MSQRLAEYNKADEKQILSALDKHSNPDLANIMYGYSGVAIDTELLNDVLLNGYGGDTQWDAYWLVQQVIDQPNRAELYLSRGYDLRPIINSVTNDGKIDLKQKYNDDFEEAKRQGSNEGIPWLNKMLGLLESMTNQYQVVSPEVKKIIMRYSRTWRNITNTTTIVMIPGGPHFIIADFISNFDKLANVQVELNNTIDEINMQGMQLGRDYIFTIDPESIKYANGTMEIEVIKNFL